MSEALINIEAAQNMRRAATEMREAVAQLGLELSGFEGRFRSSVADLEAHLEAWVDGKMREDRDQLLARVENLEGQHAAARAAERAWEQALSEASGGRYETVSGLALLVAELKTSATEAPGAALLVDALAKREKDYRASLDTVRELGDHEHTAAAATWTLREAIELVGCLRRLVRGRTVRELHAAFGAPGDFGYDTLIGDALAKIYRGEVGP